MVVRHTTENMLYLWRKQKKRNQTTMPASRRQCTRRRARSIKEVGEGEIAWERVHGAPCTKIIRRSGSPRKFQVPRKAEKWAAQINPRLPWSECQFEMMGVISDTRIAPVGFIITDLRYLRGELNVEFYFCWLRAIQEVTLKKIFAFRR